MTKIRWTSGFIGVLLLASGCESVQYSKAVILRPVPPFRAQIPDRNLRTSISSLATRTAECLETPFPGLVRTDFGDSPIITVKIIENNDLNTSHNTKVEYRVDLEFLLNEIPPNWETPDAINVYPRIISQSAVILVGRGVRANNEMDSEMLSKMEREVAKCLKQNSHLQS